MIYDVQSLEPFPFGDCKSLTRLEQISGLNCGASMCIPLLRSDFKSQIWPLGFISNLSGDLALNWISYKTIDQPRDDVLDRLIYFSISFNWIIIRWWY